MANRYRTLETITDKRRAKIIRVLSHRQLDLTIVCDNVHDPHNVSAVLRTADAIGIHTIHLIYTEESFPKIGKKSSASAKKWVNVQHYRTVKDCYDELHSQGFKIYASHLIHESTSLFSLDLTQKIALVLGNEHRGVSEEAYRLADKIFSIPMMGMIQSLNISVAAAICMYEALRQRINAGKFTSPQFDEGDLKKSIEEWARK